MKNDKDNDLIFEAYLAKKTSGKVYLEEDSVEEISETKKAALLELSERLDATNVSVFQEIKQTLGGSLYLTKFLPVVMSWMRGPSDDNDTDWLARNLVNMFDDRDPMYDAMEEIFFSSNYMQEFNGAMRDVKRLHYNTQ